MRLHAPFALFGSLVLMGCGTTSGLGGGDDVDDVDDVDQGAVAPAFPEGQGQSDQIFKAYPPGPFGIGKGSVIANYQFIGYANALKNSQALQNLELADFYNPTGDAVHEDGSVLEVGSPKPKALLLAVSAVWCGPCNYEADEVLPGEYLKYKPQGGEFFVQLADGAVPGNPATTKSLFNWTSKYDVDYPMAVDPSYKLGALFEAEAYPANIIIKTSTMEIVEVIAGAPEPGSSFWTTYEKVLSGEI